MTSQPLRREPTIADRLDWLDLAFCAAIASISVGSEMSNGPATMLLAGLLVAPLVVRRHHPAAGLAAGVVAAVAQLVGLDRPTFSIVAVPVLVYAAARWGTLVLGRTALLIGLAGSVLGSFRWVGTGLGVVDLPTLVILVTACAGIVSASYLVGRRRQERSDHARQRARAAAEQEQLRRAEEEQRAHVAAVNERNRIARELHDIVAHALSVVVVQAEGGKALAQKRPEHAPAVLGTIADTSREALQEMRQMVGLLRSGAEPQQAAYAPTPGLPDIPDLIRKTSKSAEFCPVGEVPRVSAALGLTAYRIVQESLTNVLKHAGPAAAARVTARYSPAAVELEIVDNGRGAAVATDEHGHGLQGMAERVSVHGGTLSAQPVPGGGFAVRALLPIPEDRTP